VGPAQILEIERNRYSEFGQEDLKVLAIPGYEQHGREIRGIAAATAYIEAIYKLARGIQGGFL
jgi:hypothetical protein